MKGRLLLLALVTGLATSFAWAGDGKDGEDVQRKSGTKTPVSSYPLPFVLNGDNSRTQPPISTGYYFVDSDDEAPDFWRPDPTLFVDTLTEPGTWRRIVSGPNQIPSSYWTNSSLNTFGGHAYFRNPGNMQDSTDDAFAGPISIGFPFYFNGVRYDSFYVSTNGLIALSNRRYFYEYDNNGFPTNRVRLEVAPGIVSVYDPMSDDTRGRTGSFSSPNAADINDATGDNFGFQYVACGDAVGTATAGIRTKTNQRLDQLSWGGGITPALIAPFWDDLQVSVYNSENNAVDDFGRVYYKRSPANDKLTVYFVNLTPIGAKTSRVGPVQHTITFQPNNRPGIGEHYRYSGQVTLNRNDSSVVIQYENFLGQAPRNHPQPHAATVWMRCNSTVGVVGPARRLNWSGAPSAMPAITALTYEAPKYRQSTEYLYNVETSTDGGVRATSRRNDDALTPKNFLAIKFKQWKNYLRVINVFYRVHPLNNNAPLNFSQIIPTAQANNYELLAGDLRLGAIQPVAIVQHLTNDVQGPQGVNYTRQGTNFKVRFRIINEATGKIVYNTSKAVTDANLRDSALSGVQRCDINGVNRPYQPAGTFVMPYEFVKVTFPPFEPNEFIDDQIGRMLMSVIAEPRDSVNNLLGDEWPFDDTTGLRLFVMRRLAEFNDDVGEFHIVGGAAMPSVLKWVNIEADVVDGDEITNNPPPPRLEYAAANNENIRLKSPVIRMNRYNLGGTDIPPTGQYGGDELRSFPINLNRRQNAVLSISYQRAGKLTGGIGRGFSDNRLVGPEHRVDATVTAVNSIRFIRNPDELWVEFARPSDDGLNGITNIQTWVYDPANLGANYAQPFRIWGGGGYVRGFDLTNKNQQLNSTTLPPLGGARVDLFDDGKDFEFYKVTIPVPDAIMTWVNEGARNFRFRLRVRAIRNSDAPFPGDDEDNFFIDNVKILFPDEVTDIEFSNIQLIWPYSMAPASQATRVPIRVKLSNNTNIPASAFSVRLQIKPQGDEVNQIYCRTITVPVLAGNREVILPFPDANFRTTRPGNYKITGRIFYPGNDLDTLNDSTFTTFTMTFGPSFAYEQNPLNPVNDVPKIQFSGVTGKGLNHRGYSYGGANTWGSIAGPGSQFNGQIWGQMPLGQPAVAQFGEDAGNASGSLATRFTLFSQDTVFGYQAFWAELNQDILNISFYLYRDQGGIPGDERIAGSSITRRRGEDELDNSTEAFFGRYVTYLLPAPVILAPGEYWVSVGQRGTEGYELGASESRMGMITTFYSDIPAPGLGNRTLLVDKNFRTRIRNGSLLNDNRFAFELTLGSNDWVQMTPSIGNPGYAHLDALGGIVIGYQTFPTFTRGSWIPLLRPYFGTRSFSNPPIFVPCVVPVELSFFDGRARSAGVDLFWETASEKNNAGFHVERRQVEKVTNLSNAAGLDCQDKSGAKEQPWTSIGYVAGNGTTSETKNYKFFDADVKAGGTYEYRLRQVDADGSENFSNVINVLTNSAGISLEDNRPNPSNGKTTFIFTVPVRSNVRLEVFDMMGNLINTLYNQEVPGQMDPYAFEWDGRNAAGYEVASGSYLYKLTAGDVVLTKTLSIVR